MLRIWLISGHAQNGKDTLGAEIKRVMVNKSISILGTKTIRPVVVHYGDMLKYFCSQYLEWDGKKDLAGRNLLQTVGTDIVRANNPDCWANILTNLVSGARDLFTDVIIPDVRFKNEITCWENNPAVSKVIHLRIKRFNADGSEFDNGLTPEQKAHPSECELDNEITNIVYNNGTVDQLYALVPEIIEFGMNKTYGWKSFKAAQSNQ